MKLKNTKTGQTIDAEFVGDILINSRTGRAITADGCQDLRFVCGEADDAKRLTLRGFLPLRTDRW